jgi:phosphate transport system protein
MIRTHFNRELQRLQDELIMLGSMVREAVAQSVEALVARDQETARRLIQNDRQINARKYAIEESCLTLIATQQPMAGDLRLLAAILEISTELERIGDYAKGISRINLYIGAEPLLKPLPEIQRMTQMAMEMLRRALDAFIAQDVEAARQIPKGDDEVDALYNQVNRELLDLILQKPDVLDQANYLSWVAHNLERAADRVTNICERVIYTATGEFVEFDAEEPLFSGTN